MAGDTLADAFYEELRDIYHAEKQLAKALPKMAGAAMSDQLSQAFETHLEETLAQIARVEAAFEETGKSARGKTCHAMEGLIKEAQECISDGDPSEMKDAMLIACAQKVEHYEIATYGTLCTWAKLIGYPEALAQLKQNLDEEETTDKKLTQLSEKINAAATA